MHTIKTQLITAFHHPRIIIAVLLVLALPCGAWAATRQSAHLSHPSPQQAPSSPVTQGSGSSPLHSRNSQASQPTQSSASSRQSSSAPVGSSPLSTTTKPTDMTTQTSLSAKPAPAPVKGQVAMGRFGYSAHIAWKSDPQVYTDFAKNGNATTIRDDFAWSGVQAGGKTSYNWSAPDLIMRTTAARGLDVLAMCGYSPNWANGNANNQMTPPTNPDDFAAYLKEVAKRYGKNGSFWAANPSLPYRPLRAIEVWNEPNISHFWSTGPDPAAYTRLLQKSYAAIKSVDSSITVVSAGLSPYGVYGQTSSLRMNPLTYLEQMYANGAKGSFDVLGWHPYYYSQNATAASMLKYETWSGWSQMADTPVSARSIMTANGDSTKKIWATELGAPTALGYVSETDQAQLATGRVAAWKSYAWAGNFYWYDLRDDCTAQDNTECTFGAIRYNNTAKPVYSALSNAYK